MRGTSPGKRSVVTTVTDSARPFTLDRFEHGQRVHRADVDALQVGSRVEHGDGLPVPGRLVVVGLDDGRHAEAAAHGVDRLAWNPRSLSAWSCVPSHPVKKATVPPSGRKRVNSSPATEPTVNGSADTDVRRSVHGRVGDDADDRDLRLAAARRIQGPSAIGSPGATMMPLHAAWRAR